MGGKFQDFMGDFSCFFELSHVEIAPSHMEKGFTECGTLGKILDHSFKLLQGFGMILLVEVNFSQTESSFREQFRIGKSLFEL